MAERTGAWRMSGALLFSRVASTDTMQLTVAVLSSAGRPGIFALMTGRTSTDIIVRTLRVLVDALQ
ncbi:MAG: hypothetical protein ABSH41_11845 [Syntrophobacteraceae bacterium]|jgi:hypothetical protein